MLGSRTDCDSELSLCRGRACRLCACRSQPYDGQKLWGGEQVDEEEVAAGLGPGWPSARVLANLQQHCIALSYEAGQHSSQGAADLSQQETCASLTIRRAMPIRLCQSIKHFIFMAFIYRQCDGAAEPQ